MAVSLRGWNHLEEARHLQLKRSQSARRPGAACLQGQGELGTTCVVQGRCRAQNTHQVRNRPSLGRVVGGSLSRLHLGGCQAVQFTELVERTLVADHARRVAQDRPG